MTPLFAASLYGDFILFFAFIVFCVIWMIVESVQKASKLRTAPSVQFDIVFPNGLKKWVHAKTAEEATATVTNDVNLKHDVVLYYPDGRVAGVVRVVGKGEFSRTWFERS